MAMLKNLAAATCAIVCVLTLQPANAAANIGPIVDSFGDVAPPTDQFRDAFRTRDDGPWLVTFNLVAAADTIVGARSLDENSFHVDHVALYADGKLIAPEVCVLIVDGCPDELHLPLSPGQYALGVFGDGNRTLPPPGGDPFDPRWDLPDFRVYIQVVPEPETYALMLAGLGLIGFMARRRRN